MNRFRSAIHNKIHGVKVSRQMKHGLTEPDRSFEDECETSSSSDAESSANTNVQQFGGESNLAVEFVIDSIVDLPSGTSYFYVCVGETGEPVSRKRRRGILSSRVLHSKSPLLNPEESCFILRLDGISMPEVSLRFSKSALMGQDGFLGEAHFCISVKGGVDSSDEHAVTRIMGGGNAHLACHWRVVPFTHERRPNILPDERLTSDADKLQALVDSVRKCLNSLSEDDPEFDVKSEWISSLFEVLEPVELNFLIVRLPLGDILRLMPSVLFRIEPVLSRDSLDVFARNRVIKAVQMEEYSGKGESLVSAMLQGCADRDMRSLKWLLNRGGDRFHLQSLVFSFLRSELVREQVILRFQQYASRNPTSTPLHVLSEVDQVIHSPFGSVRLWPDGTIPGARALFHALSRDVTFVSNKPLSFESWNHKIIRKAGFEDCPLLSGSKSDLYAIKGGVAKLQSRLEFSKYTNWSQYRRLFPESRFVWFGESLEFAKMLLQDESGIGSSQRYGVGRITLALVLGEEGSCKIGPYTAQPGLIVCGNFVQASIACLNEGLLTESRILRGLVSDFTTIVKKMEADCVRSGKRNRHLIRERLSELKLDLEKLKTIVEERDLKVETIREDMVDSLILTPIEAQSPTLTDRSIDTNTEDMNPSASRDPEVVIMGI